MTDRIHHMAERLWAIIALIAAGVAAHDIYSLGWPEGRTSLLFPAIAGAWYFTRRALRNKVEGAKAEKEPPSKGD